MAKDTTPTNSFLDELTRAREGQAEAERMRVDARLRLRLAVLDAHLLGSIGATDIARHLGISRQAVYELLEAARKDFPNRF